MQEQEKSPIEEVSLSTGGSIPGIPGHHGPGRYLVNWLERTITPIVDAVESVVDRVKEAVHPAEPKLVPSPEGTPAEALVPGMTVLASAPPSDPGAETTSEPND